MNQRNHSRPNCGSAANKLFLRPPPSPPHAHFPLRFSPRVSGFGKGVAPEQRLRAHLWRWWLIWVLVLDLQPSPSRYSIPKWAATPPGVEAWYPAQRTGQHGVGLMGSPTWCMPPTTSISLRGLVHSSFTVELHFIPCWV